MTTPPPRKGLMRNLGEFFGHIAQGVRTPVGPQRTVLRKEVQEETRQTESGPVVLRRTIIEEVEVRPPEPARHTQAAEQHDAPAPDTGDERRS